MSAAAGQVVEFVRALALGWKNLAAYPPGHPVLANSLNLISKRLAELRGPAGDIALGVVRDGVVYGQEKIDSSYAQKFGNALYTRGVAIVRFDSDTDTTSVETFLRLLGTGNAPDAQRPIWEELTAQGVMSIHLQPVDYSDIQVSDDLDADRPKTDAEHLWEEILTAIMEGRELTAEGQHLLAQKVRSASELAMLIMKYVSTLDENTEFDPDATFGVKFTYRVDGGGSEEDIGKRIGQTLEAFIARSQGERRETGVKQAIELLKTLPESMRDAVIRSVIRALADEEAAGALLNTFVSQVRSDEVLESLRYLSGTMNLSNHAMRLLESLMSTSAPVTDPGHESGESVITELAQLFGDEEDIDRFNPDDHSQLLDQVSVQIPDGSTASVRPTSDLGDRLDTVGTTAVSRALADTLLALVRSQGPRQPPWAVLQRLENVFQSDIAEGRFDQALAIVRSLQEQAILAPNPALQDAIHDTFERMGTAETIRTVIDAGYALPEQRLEVVKQLLEILGTAAAKNLLMMLAEESNRSRRRKLFDFVSSLGSVIIPQVKPFLADRRWFVVRNMIALVYAVGDKSLLPDIRKCAAHPDLRVRLEAIKTLLALEPNPPRGLLEDAIRDPDPKVAEKAIALVGSYGIREAVDPLLQIVAGNDVWGARRPLRVRALRALGELAEPSALPRLDRFFTDSFFPWPAREERRVAYETLAAYPPDARAPFVERGRKSRDPYVRDLCEKMAS
jgi:HEAT repeat protein